MYISGNSLWVSAGSRDQSWGQEFNIRGIYHYVINSTWNSYNVITSNFDNFYDILSIAIDPKDENHLFLGSWGYGVAEFNDKKIIERYTPDNSPLTAIQKNTYAAGIAFDKNQNLWVTNFGNPNPVSVLKKDKTWVSLPLNNQLLSKSGTLSSIYITSWGHKWMLLSRGGGIAVLDDNGTIDNTADDKVKLLTVSLISDGKTTNAEVNAISEDLQGNIWIATEIGIGIYYNAANIFNDQNPAPQQVIVEQDGFAGYLLSTENCTSIAVDGANQKWIGTERSGVYLVSGDGDKLVQHFTAENSPLLNNYVRCLAINNNSGEVFFGTNEGIISYKGAATEAKEDYASIYAYPNPVPANYNGSIGIKGLVGFVNVKVTDISGKLVYETKSQGGQAIWDGKNLNGQKVQSGVYLIYCTDDLGEQTTVSKILFLN